MTEFNTNLPTQLVVGWTTPDKVTDEQIDELLRELVRCSVGRHNGRFKTAIEIRNRERTAIREWLASL